jgi:hypothetical protein
MASVLVCRPNSRFSAICFTGMPSLTQPHHQDCTYQCSNTSHSPMK